MRVRIVPGPWPERIGCTGTIVAAPAGYDRYPWRDLDTKYEAIVLLDDDPLWRPQDPDDFGGQSWSFAIDRNHLEAL